MRRVGVLTMLVVLASLVSCDRAPGRGGYRGYPADFNSLVTAYSEAIDTYPEHIKSQEARKALMEAIARERDTTIADPRTQLMVRLGDTGLGLAVAQEISAELTSGSAEQARVFHERVLREHSDEAIGAFACDQLLSLARDSSEADFLSLCDKLIAAADHSKAKSVALLRRAEHYDSSGELKWSALDSLRYWTLFPDKVEAAGLALTFIGRLERAGFALEAEMLDVTDGPCDAAKTVLGRLEGSVAGPGSEGTSHPQSLLNAVYCRYTPDVDRMLSATGEQDGADALERALFLARVTRLQIARLNPQDMIETLPAYLAVIEQVLTQDLLSRRDAQELALVNLGLYNGVKQMCAADGLTRASPDSRGSRSTIRFQGGRLQAKLSESQVALLGRCAEKAVSEGVDAAQRDVERLVQFAALEGQRQGVVAAYQVIIGNFPQSDHACRALLEMGKYYEDGLASHSLAIETYRRVVNDFPHKQEAVAARLRCALVQYEAQDYVEAHITVQELLARPVPEEQVPVAQMLAALCEAGLGMKEVAVSHMWEIAERHPQSKVAARCLFWLGSQALAEQHYDDARLIFRDILERYPDSSYSERAAEYVARLDKLGDNS